MTRGVSLVMGIGVNIFLVMVTLWILPLPGTLKGFPAGLEHLAGIALVLLYFGYSGITVVPVGHSGVLKLFGTRRPGTTYIEGYWYLLPWPIMDMVAVNIKRNVINLENFEGVTQDGIRVAGKASVYYRITNPYQSLSVEEGVIGEGLRELMESALREALSAVSVENLVNDYGSAEERMRMRIRAEADRRAGDWGLEIDEVKISNLRPDEDVIEQYGRIKQEEKQRLAERIEAEGVKERIEIYRGSNLSPVEARDTDQVERSKTKKVIDETRLGISEEVRDLALAIAQVFMAGRK